MIAPENKERHGVWSPRFFGPVGIWKVMGSTPVGDSENSFSEYFDLTALLCYLHFIQVTNPFGISQQAR